MPRLERVRIYPVKGLDATEVESAEILDRGTLAGDREFALFDADVAPDGDIGEESPHDNGVFNAKHSERFHTLDTSYDPGTTELAVEPDEGETRTFDLDAEQKDAAAWFGDYFDHDLALRRDESIGFVDRRTVGPSVVSTATLEAVTSWFEETSVEGARRRLRANLEVSGVPAFWEDRFVGEDAPAFEVGGVRIEGVTPCARCVVPERDPETGEPTPEFRERFLEKREETFPEWADRDAFDHLYTLMLIAEVPEDDRVQSLAVGDAVEVVD
jgi:uncharacterized protein YcbX